MSDDVAEETEAMERGAMDASETSALAQTSSTYKVLGELAAEDGAGVLGHNTATSGAAIGVEGVTESSVGYGLSTPDDARIDGVAELAALGGAVTGGTAISTLAGEGLTVDGSGSLRWTGTYRTYAFSASGTTANAISGLSGPTRVEVTVDATTLSDGRVAVDVDGALRAETIDGVLHRILEPTSSLTLRSEAYFTYDVAFGISEDAGPRGVSFKSDGTRMYVVGDGGDSVYSYDLATAWDVDTASYTGNAMDVSGQTSYPRGVRFKSDGTKMFVPDANVGDVHSYSLSSAWDLTSASYLTTHDTSGQTSDIAGISFGDGGSKLFVLGGGVVYTYDLLTAWDLNSATYNDVSRDLTETGGYDDLTFDADGTKMYVADDSDDSVYSYILRTPWDVTSADIAVEFDVSSQADRAAGLEIKPDESKLYVVDVGIDSVVQWNEGYAGTAFASVERE